LKSAAIDKNDPKRKQSTHNQQSNGIFFFISMWVTALDCRPKPEYASCRDGWSERYRAQRALQRTIQLAWIDHSTSRMKGYIIELSPLRRTLCEKFKNSILLDLLPDGTISVCLHLNVSVSQNTCRLEDRLCDRTWRTAEYEVVKNGITFLGVPW